jgi:hypothetical protein
VVAVSITLPLTRRTEPSRVRAWWGIRGRDPRMPFTLHTFTSNNHLDLPYYYYLRRGPTLSLRYTTPYTAILPYQAPKRTSSKMTRTEVCLYPLSPLVCTGKDIPLMRNSLSLFPHLRSLVSPYLPIRPVAPSLLTLTGCTVIASSLRPPRVPHCRSPLYSGSVSPLYLTTSHLDHATISYPLIDLLSPCPSTLLQ